MRNDDNSDSKTMIQNNSLSSLIAKMVTDITVNTDVPVFKLLHYIKTALNWDEF